jgi:translation initiation factor IF-3
VVAISSEYKINEEIRAKRCRLIDADGEQLGIFDVRDALRRAEDQGYDLVEIAPQADPPVCKIMDYGKFRYEQSMKAKQARKHQQKIEIKEMKFRPKVDTHDYNTKKGHILRFLDKGAKVKVTIMFRGREMAHPELGLNILVRLAEELEDLAIIENQPKLEGRNMHMLISPLKKKPEEKADNA